MDNEGKSIGVHLNKVTWPFLNDQDQAINQGVNVAEQILEETFINIIHPKNYEYPEHKEHVILAKEMEIIGWKHFNVYEEVREDSLDPEATILGSTVCPTKLAKLFRV